MASVVLSGFSGTGKSSVGPLVASRLGLPFLDTDQEVARRAGLSVAEIWRTQGERAFRRLEEDVVRERLTDGVPRVLSFGGGAVTSRASRLLALDHAVVVTLTARPATILARLPDRSGLPALAGPDPLAEITALLALRAGAYAECHARLATDDRSPDEVAALVVEESRRGRIVVPLEERTYGVEVVDGAPQTLRDNLAALRPSSLLVVSDAQVRAARGEALSAALAGLDVAVTDVTLLPGEEHKTLASVQAIWDAAIAARLDRRSVILGFGGGVVGDLAGFAASTLLRGVRVVQSPTTLLAMVDASVGGKTGFDLAAGKNLVGTFHQPSAVVADVAHLTTLPRRDLLAGLAEVVKIALVCDDALWLDLEARAEQLRAGEPAVLLPIIRRAIQRKAEVVRDDEREGGRRALLNLGHTVGHGLEALGGYSQLRHGEAVALGLVAEARAGERLAGTPPALTERLRALLERLGLPTEPAPGAIEAAWPLIALDKKRTGSHVALPVARRLGEGMVASVPLLDLALALGVPPTG